MSTLFAFLHHLCAFTLVSAVAIELALIRGELTLSSARRLQATDMVATVPRSLAEALVSFGTVRMFDLPFETPKFDLKQYWHARFHRDPANQWLRQLVYESFIQGI